MFVCRFETLDSNSVLQLNPTVPGVFGGPYPLGIDPVCAASHKNTIETDIKAAQYWKNLTLEYIFFLQNIQYFESRYEEIQCSTGVFI